MRSRSAERPISADPPGIRRAGGGLACHLVVGDGLLQRLRARGLPGSGGNRLIGIIRPPYAEGRSLAPASRSWFNPRLRGSAGGGGKRWRRPRTIHLGGCRESVAGWLHARRCRRSCRLHFGFRLVNLLTFGTKVPAVPLLRALEPVVPMASRRGFRVWCRQTIISRAGRARAQQRAKLATIGFLGSATASTESERAARFCAAAARTRLDRWP
jgi:hypothetical protein